jgi:DNA-binding NarL/FixJ family response regulator
VREGIANLLSLTADILVVGQAEDGWRAEEQVRALKPDVLLLDVRMPGRGGLETLEALQRGPLPVPTLMLTTFEDDVALLQAMRARARGFLLKDVSPEHLAEAIRTVHAGGTLLLPTVTERVRDEVQAVPATFPSEDAPEDLTPREREVLRLMAAGMSNREIAEALRGAEGTVKNHVSHILAKLGVRDRTRAVLRALERDLI